MELVFQLFLDFMIRKSVMSIAAMRDIMYLNIGFS